jgi:hypothetical protein
MSCRSCARRQAGHGVEERRYSEVVACGRSLVGRVLVGIVIAHRMSSIYMMRPFLVLTQRYMER